MELGLDLAFYSLDRESIKQTSDEAKLVLDGFESMSFDLEDFNKIYTILKPKYT